MILPGIRTVHRLLVHAALDEDPESALAAWRDWQARVRIESLDHGSTRLLPELVFRLGRLGEDPAHMPARLQGLARHAWASNRQILHDVGPALERLDAAGAEPVLIGSAGVLRRVLRHDGRRLLRGLDVLVNAPDPAQTLAVAAECGWHPADGTRPAILHALPAVRLFRRGPRPLVLHRRRYGEDGDAACRAQASLVDGHRVAAAEYLLLDAVREGLFPPRRPALEWMADVVAVLRASEGGLEEVRVRDLAACAGLRAELRLAAEILDAMGLGDPRLPTPDPAPDDAPLRRALWDSRLQGRLPFWRREFARRSVRAEGVQFPDYVRHQLDAPPGMTLVRMLLRAVIRRVRA